MFKEYLIKIHDKDNVFKKTLSNNLVRDSFVNFTTTINRGQGQLTLSYNIDHIDFDLEMFDVAYIYYEGTLIYRGFLFAYSKVIRGSSEYVDVTFQGMQGLFKYIIYEKDSSRIFDRNADPAIMLDELITILNTQRGRTVFNTGVTFIGSLVNLSFSYENGLTAIDRIMKNVNGFLDFRTNGDVILSGFDESTADHVLTFEKHITEFVCDVDSINMANNMTLIYDGGNSSTTDSSSQNAYGELEFVINDTTVKDSSTASGRLTAEIEARKDPDDRIQLAINDSYDIESINIGDTIKIANKEDDLGIRTVKRIDYRESLATLYLSDFDSVEQEILSIQQ